MQALLDGTHALGMSSRPLIVGLQSITPRCYKVVGSRRVKRNNGLTRRVLFYVIYRIDVIAPEPLCNHLNYFATIGQLISKWFFGVIDFLQKTNERIRLYHYDTSDRLVFVRFWGEIDDPKNHFEINWPLRVVTVRRPNRALLRVTTESPVNIVVFYSSNIFDELMNGRLNMKIVHDLW